LIWDTTTWEHRAEFDGKDVIQWSPDGTRLVAVSAEHTLGIWDAATVEPLITLSGHTDVINALAWSPDGGQLVSGSADGTVRVWDAMTGNAIAVLPRENAVLAVAWSPDSHYIVAGIEGSTSFAAPDVIVTAWDAANFEPASMLHAAGYTESVMWAPDGIRLASAEGSMVKIWDSHTGKLLHVLDGYESNTSQVRWSPDGTLLAVQGNADSPVWIWDTTLGEHLATFGEYGQPFSYALGSWSPDSIHYAHGQPGGSIAIFDARSGELLMSLPKQSSTYPGDIEWSPDGAHLAAWVFGDDGSFVRIWDTNTRQLLDTMPGYGSIRWSPDGARLAYSDEDGLHLYDIDASTQVVIDTESFTVAWSSNGQHIATWWNPDCSMQDQVQIWDADSGERLAALDGGEGAWIDFVLWLPYGISRSTCGGAHYIAYSPDGTRWAIGYGFGIEVWKHGED
jgi:WD40 repeat protein